MNGPLNAVIQFFDESEQQNALFLVRQVSSGIILGISLEKNGDIETHVPNDKIDEILRAIERLANRQ